MRKVRSAFRDSLMRRSGTEESRQASGDTVVIIWALLMTPPSSYRLLFPFIAAVAESIMLNICDVDGLPGHPHAERGLLIDPDVPHSEPRSCRRREAPV